ncbi:olfactory receptor 52K1-like [Ambystoma mexicanum]|uniref:olfactory receptor 52K1-like n=1 Tax=Ambystoma mexicanum TaxID=8296 RepID=UPI0037E93CF4
MGPQQEIRVDNISIPQPSMFILMGIPGLEEFYPWIAIPFCSAYIIALLGNVTLLLIIYVDPRLHEPMYLFLCMLSIIDLVLSTSTMPKMLGILWFDFREIIFDACLIQLFFLHSFAIMESSVLLAMAFDRYVAICNPLRYTTILTRLLIGKIGLAVVVRAVAFMSPLPFLLKRLPFCGSNLIHHSYCEHMAVVKLACADTTFNNIYGMTLVSFIVGLDLLFIILSYILILRAVFSLASRQERLTAIGTCVSHIGAILTFYVPVSLTSIIHRFGHSVPLHVHILLASCYLMGPPMVNPIIYGVKTKQIRDNLNKIFFFKKTLDE